jgi:hypothetical protein
MKKLLPILMLAGFSSPAFADITHKLSSSVQLTVNAAATQVERVANTYAVSGNGLDSTYGSGDNAVTNGIGAMTFSSGVGTVADTTFTQDVPGASFSLSQSFVQGDALVTSAPATGAVSAGTVGNLAGTITTAGAMTVAAGGAGTVATGQFVNELTIN